MVVDGPDPKELRAYIDRVYSAPEIRLDAARVLISGPTTMVLLVEGDLTLTP